MPIQILGLLLLLASWAGAVTQEPTIDTRYKDPKQPMNTRIKSLVAQMTLKEKIGQMAQIDRVEATPEIMREFSIGSIISAAGSTPHQDHRATPEQWVDMVNEYQNGSLSSRLGIPMLYAIDSVHGHNSLYKATLFPHNVGLGATRDPELVKRIGAATAVETRATGIPYAFSPCIAVCRDPRWGRCYESYSEDHKIVEQMTDIILGLQGELPSNSMKGVRTLVESKFYDMDKVVACAKHFVGDGGTIHGIDENNTLTDWKGMLNIHMPGYYHSIIKGVSTIMVSYSSWNGVKMHSNRNLITQFLKTTLKFRVMVPPNHTEFLHILTSHVNNKLIPMSRIDDASQKNFEGQVQDGANPDVKSLKANEYSYAIVVVGESPYAEQYGDNLNLTIPEPGLSTMKNVCSRIKCVVVIISGRPLAVEPYLPMMDALVAAWSPNQGQGVGRCALW
ncbi:hypothetical protein DH2020_030538 [Rehmannia glutinosa]|uniref:Glycoside hydrolase family 3 N-terminal domain-containing protein n=1 Tax=Rehmannia glutinosa TaxID=99300 RepID=A0ABR0VNP5_REHGL